MHLTLEPGCECWRDLIGSATSGTLDGRDLAEWRRETRAELGLATDKPVIATGHQTLLWHPGILVKYLAVQAVVDQDDGLAPANLVVDQHVSDFGRFDVPLRRADGALDVAHVELVASRDGVPMAGHPAFKPRRPPMLRAALPSVGEGVERIWQAVADNADEPNAALQMARALGDLMDAWVRPWPDVTASDLMHTTLATRILAEMAKDPRRCALAYNAALAGTAGIGALKVTASRLELPLWKLTADGRRVTADDADLRDSLAAGLDGGAPTLLPKALLLTMLVRVGMCDLFVHGSGGAAYDEAMARWLRDWLGLEPAPIAVASATLRLPLRRDDEPLIALPDALTDERRVLANPEPGAGPGPLKRELLAAVDAAPRRTSERYDAFRAMHEQVGSLRLRHRDEIAAAAARVATARRQAEEAPIADRRDWAFPLYPQAMISALANEVRSRLREPCGN